MKFDDPNLITPIYIKTADSTKVPDEDKVAYLLSSDGLYMCRDTQFFRSCAPARNWPSELASHAPSLQLRFPRLPQPEFERLVGFFTEIADREGAEAGALILWNKKSESVELWVPEQKSKVSVSWAGRPHPLDLHYDVPLDLPSHLVSVGDVHSHVDEAAYASATDKHDEMFRPGAHLVVGRIHRNPPEFHCEFVVDGHRFRVDPFAVVEGYESPRMDFPAEWLDRVEVKSYGWGSSGWTGDYSSGGSSGPSSSSSSSSSSGDYWSKSDDA